MLKREFVIIDPYHRIDINLFRDSRGALVLHLQEGETDPEEPGVFKFMLCQSWSVTVAREKFPRCTAKVIAAFWAKYITDARSRATARAQVVRESLKETPCTPSE